MSAYLDKLKLMFRQTRRGYPAIPDNALQQGQDVETRLAALSQRVDRLQEVVEILSGIRGDVLDQHVAVRDLLSLNIINSSGRKP
jgi:hypothetical protein